MAGRSRGSERCIKVGPWLGSALQSLLGPVGSQVRGRHALSPNRPVPARPLFSPSARLRFLIVQSFAVSRASRAILCVLASLLHPIFQDTESNRRTVGGPGLGAMDIWTNAAGKAPSWAVGVRGSRTRAGKGDGTRSSREMSP